MNVLADSLVRQCDYRIRFHRPACWNGAGRKRDDDQDRRRDCEGQREERFPECLLTVWGTPFLSGGQIQTEIVLDLFPPGIHHLRLLRKLRPFRHGGANFLDDGLGAAAFHQALLAQARKSASVNPSRLPFIVIWWRGGPAAGGL